MRVAVVSRVNVQVQFGGNATEILYQDGVERIRHQNSNRSGLRSTFPFLVFCSGKNRDIIQKFKKKNSKTKTQDLRIGNPN